MRKWQRITKKWVAMLLTLTMCMSLFSAPAFADDVEGFDAGQVVEAADADTSSDVALTPDVVETDAPAADTDTPAEQNGEEPTAPAVPEGEEPDAETPEVTEGETPADTPKDEIPADVSGNQPPADLEEDENSVSSDEVLNKPVEAETPDAELKEIADPIISKDQSSTGKESIEDEISIDDEKPMDENIAPAAEEMIVEGDMPQVLLQDAPLREIKPQLIWAMWRCMLMRRQHITHIHDWVSFVITIIY